MFGFQNNTNNGNGTQSAFGRPSSAGGNHNPFNMNNNGNGRPQSAPASNLRGRGGSRGRGRGRGGRQNRNEDRSSNFSNTNYFQKSQNAPQQRQPMVNSQPTPPGFKLRQRKKRKTPPYLLPGQSSVQEITSTPDPWDLDNQKRMLDVEGQMGHGDMQSLYEKFQEMRENERKEMEKRGLVDRQDTRKNLSEAISFVGTCADMCPTFERVRRTYENNFKQLEKDPVTDKVTRQYAVKAFSRPAAGQPPPLPSDVRPPSILKSTLYYLIDNVVPNLPASHSFLWDRTRSIRQDFTYQNFAGDEAIECNELIARIHISTLHTMAGSDQDYSRQQELEQFNKTLQTLSEIYSERRKLGLPQAPREAEFRAYQLLSHLRDADIERQVQELPVELFESKEIQLALKLRGQIQQNNNNQRGSVYHENAANFFSLFFKSVKTEAPYLFSCLLESSFNDIRFYSLKAMSRAYHQRGKPYYISRLTEILGFDSTDDAMEYCLHYDLPRSDNDSEPCIEVTAWNESNALSKQPLSQAYTKWIDRKVENRTIQDIIYNGDHFGKEFEMPKPQFTTTTLPSKVSPVPKPDIKPATAPVTEAPSAFSFGSKSPSFAPTSTSASTSAQSAFSVPPKNDQSTKPAESTLFPQKPDLTFKFPEKPKSSPSPAPPPPPVVKPEPEKPAPPPPQPQPQPQPAPKFTLDELEGDANLVLKKIIGPILREEIIPARWNAVAEARNERTKALESLSNEVFGELVNSVVRDQLVISRAKVFDSNRLKRAAIHAIKQTGLIAKERADEKRRRREEYEQVTKLLGRTTSSIKRSNSNRRKSSLNQKQQVELIKKTRKESSLAWERMTNLNQLLLPSITRTFKQLRSFDRSVQIALFCPDWDSTTGQWLKNKIGLEWSGQTFRTILKDNKTGTNVEVAALENDSERSSNVCSLLFECGISTPEYDAAALKKVLPFLSHSTKYKFTLVLVYWGDLSEIEFLSQLELDQTGYPDIATALFVPMAQNSSAQLQRCLQFVGDKFDGALSQVGVVQRDEILHEQQLAAQARQLKRQEQERQQQQAQEEERYRTIRAKNSLRLFSRPAVPKEMATGTGSPPHAAADDVPLKRKRDELVPRGVAELRALLSDVSKKSRNE